MHDRGWDGSRQRLAAKRDCLASQQAAQASIVQAGSDLEGSGATVHWLDAGGLRLRAASWPGAGRGTVLLLNGRTEFIEKYIEPVAELRARGFAVWTFDWRGQGLSRFARTTPAQHETHFTPYLDDLDLILDSLVLPALRGRPLVLIGHSMGGHLGAHALARRPDLYAQAVLLAPMIGLLNRGRRPPPFAGILTRLACLVPGQSSRFGPGTQRSFDPARPFETNRLTQCPDRYAADMALVAARPELAVGGVSWGWIGAALRSNRKLFCPATLARITMPVLVALAGADTVVDNRPARRFALALAHGQLLEIAGARHELLREHDGARNALWSAVDAFLAPVSLAAVQPLSASASAT